MKNIVNIINFVRGVEPRPRDIDLQKPVIEQIRLLRENELRGTFLLQYDALIDESYLKLMDSCKDICEIGLWIEIVQPLVEKIGEPWRGRYSWDWHNDVGFLIGYEPQVRIRLIDAAMEQFKATFGYYPESVGSWHIDAVSMKYLAEKYNVVACCICRDQVGTDGYTMQGGYFNQAYYPSAYNMFCPANTKENQINMPVFRMLGSDPIYAYDYQSVDYGVKACATLEPACGKYNPDFDKWSEWFMDEVFDGSGVSFQYTQVGQENSFGWPRMGKGLEYQFPMVKRLVDEGRIEVMTLGESGRWYKDTFDTTPPAAISALTDWKNDKYKSVWFYSKYYRMSLMWNDGELYVRDMYIFDENFKERYYDKCCTTTACEFRNLPVLDCTIYSGDTAAGAYFTDGEKTVKWDNITYSEKDGAVILTVSNADGHAVITMAENKVTVRSNVKTLKLVTAYDKEKVYGRGDSEFGNHNNKTTELSFVTKAKAADNKLTLTINGFDYGFDVTDGTLTDSFDIISDNGNITIEL